MKELTIVYDGKCPICRNYSQLVEVDKSLGPVNLVDARHPSSIRQELSNRHYNLDQGMIVQFQNKVYFGAEAVNFLAKVNGRSNFLNRIYFSLFRSKTVSSTLYPALRAFRNFLLWVLNVPKINNLKKDIHDE